MTTLIQNLRSSFQQDRTHGNNVNWYNESPGVQWNSSSRMADDRDNPPHLSVFLVLFIFFFLPDPLFMLILFRLSNVLRSGGV